MEHGEQCDNGRTDVNNRYGCGHDALKDVYCVENVIKKRDMECGEDVKKYLYQTSVFIDWDRRKSLRIDPILGGMDEEGNSILWGAEIGNCESQGERKVWHAMKQ